MSEETEEVQIEEVAEVSQEPETVEEVVAPVEESTEEKVNG